MLNAGKTAQRFDSASVAAAVGAQRTAPALSMGRSKRHAHAGGPTADCRQCQRGDARDRRRVKRPWRRCDENVKYRVTNVRYERV